MRWAATLVEVPAPIAVTWSPTLIVLTVAEADFVTAVLAVVFTVVVVPSVAFTVSVEPSIIH